MKRQQNKPTKPPFWLLSIILAVGLVLLWSPLLGPLSTMETQMPVDRHLQIILNTLASLGLILLLLLYRRLK